MAKLTQSDKRSIIVQALNSCNKRIAQFAHDNNLQVREMYIKNKGYQAALEDVLLLIDGNASHIKCHID